MNRLTLYLFPALASLLSVFPAQAQNPNQNHLEEILTYSEEYLDAADGNAALFSGRIQSNMPGGIESMYLRSKYAVERDSFGEEIFPRPVPPTLSYDLGDIFYDGVLYSGVKMRLDLYRDELSVVPTEIMFLGAVLEPGRLGYADLRGYRIVTSPSEDLPGIYYLQLHDGPNRVLKREFFGFDRGKGEFVGRTIRYYIGKEGVWHNVGRRRGKVLRVFRDRGDELRRFIRAQMIDVRRDTENALVEIVKEYERLTDR